MPVTNHHLYYEQDLRVPMTHLTLVFHGAGMQQEVQGKTGLARITAKMLFRGTPVPKQGSDIPENLSCWERKSTRAFRKLILS